MTRPIAASAACLLALAASPAIARQPSPAIPGVTSTAPKAPGVQAPTVQAPGPLQPAASMHGRLPPGAYISGPTLPDTTLILPPPPLPGSPEQAADDAVFRASRKLQGTPRWTLAQNDAKLRMTDVLAGFSCALGFAIDPQHAPALLALLSHAGADMAPEIDRAKDRWQRRRPYIGNDAPICVPRHGSLDDNPSYPSGHTTFEYGTALILAELVPERAAQILQRGRVMGESRVVCGVHWLSDVQGGYLQATALVDAMNASPAFRADLERARGEIAAARRPAAPAGQAIDPAECRIEADAAAHSLLFRLQPGD